MNQSFPYLDTNLTLQQRVDDLVSRLTLEEKISQMLHYAPAIDRLGIPAYNWWNECLHGVARAGVATVFPQAVGMAATFDTSLLQEVATAISDEARAKHHEFLRKDDHGIYKGLTFWSPNVNIFRDPRWGRGHETYGEDPYLTSRLGVSFIQGLQGHDPNYLKTAACAKHFAVHSGPENERHSFNAIATKKDLYETYLPAFEACVKEGQVEAVMGAYNRTNGEPCCGSYTLLKHILRDDWGFEGHVVSDCWAICDFHKHHQITDTPQASAALAVKAGSDLNCGNTYATLLSAVEQGLIDEVTIDQAVKRLFRTRFKLGQFDPDELVPYTSIPYSLNDCKEHHDLAIDTARKGMVLLKNKQLLPLNSKHIKSIAVIGPNADDRSVLLGNYNGTPSQTCTPLEGVQNIAGDSIRVYYALGCEILKDRTESLAHSKDRIAEAVSAAESCDVAVVCLGLNALLEGEEGDASNSHAGGDKVDLQLPGLQNHLLQEVVATGTPTIVVVLSGSAVDLRWANEHAAAIIQAWYPGAQGGIALAELLFGLYDFSGRLPITFIQCTEDLPNFKDYSMKGRTYRYLEKDPLYPFGYGLSYNTYTYSNLQLSKTVLTQDDDLIVEVTVSNEGSIAGRTVIQAYIQANLKDIITPHWSLAGFETLELNSKESKIIRVTIGSKQFLTVDDDGNSIYIPGTYTLYIGGNQPDLISEALTGQKVLKCDITLN